MSKWKFLGYDIPKAKAIPGQKPPYYTEGIFTVGEVYEMVPGSRIDYMDDPEFPPEAKFIDDRGLAFVQELQYFEEVA